MVISLYTADFSMSHSNSTDLSPGRVSMSLVMRVRIRCSIDSIRHMALSSSCSVLFIVFLWFAWLWQS